MSQLIIYLFWFNAGCFGQEGECKKYIHNTHCTPQDFGSCDGQCLRKIHPSKFIRSVCDGETDPNSHFFYMCICSYRC